MLMRQRMQRIHARHWKRLSFTQHGRMPSVIYPWAERQCSYGYVLSMVMA